MESRDSKYNGKLEVWRDLAWGTHIVAGNITQSGGVAKKVWQSTLKQLHPSNTSVSSCLILGLGGGSIAKLINALWPKAKITGVEIDPEMVDLGKKHLGLDEEKVEIFLEDVSNFLDSHSYKYDLVCIDMYVGTQVPKEFSTKEFVKKVQKLMAPSGVAVFNRTYYDEKRKEALEFEKVLHACNFAVERFFPEANVMFICKKA